MCRGAGQACRRTRCVRVRTIALRGVLPRIWAAERIVLQLVVLERGLVLHLAFELVDVRARPAEEAHAFFPL